MNFLLHLPRVALSEAETEVLSTVPEGAACVATDTQLVNLSESADEDSVEVATVAEAAPQPEWTESAQSVSLTNTLTMLTLAGVPALNASLSETAPRLRTIATVTTTEFAQSGVPRASQNTFPTASY